MNQVYVNAESEKCGPEEIGPSPDWYSGWLAPEAERLERLDDLLCQAADVVQNFNHRASSKGKAAGDNEPSFGVSHSADSFNSDGVAWKSGEVDWGGFESAELGLKGKAVWFVSWDPLVVCLPHRERPSCAAAIDRHDGNVLVSDVQIVCSSQYLVAPAIRLECADEVEHVTIGTLHPYLYLPVQLLLAVCEGKVDALRCGAAQRHKVVCKDVESGSEVVNGVTKDHSQVIGNVLTSCELKAVLAGVCVELQEQSPRITVHVLGDFRVEVCDVMPAAGGLEFWPDEGAWRNSRRGHGRPYE